MSKLYLYTIFHCNLAFSSIPEADYPAVIEGCYWPLLRLAGEGIPVGIETTARTLREIERIDPSFIKTLSELWNEGKCEFIGSGYAQIIMPLVPAEVNAWNLEAGNRHYRELLGRAPDVIFINEQTFSRGCVDICRAAGYSAIIMDWSNCYRYNRYNREYLYYPQKAMGINSDIPVLWNHSIAFQKFQRCVHGEIDEAEYLDFLFSHYSSSGDRAFLLYGNDAEVFDYRPGVGVTAQRNEYERIRDLLIRVREDRRSRLMLPGGVIDFFKDYPGANHRISLESPETPLVCKKQEKYNPIRWAVTGRDSVHLNTACHRIYLNIKAIEGAASATRLDGFREMLCELWGSDFRTNTIDEKLMYFHNRLGWITFETEDILQKMKGRPREESSDEEGVIISAGEAWEDRWRGRGGLLLKSKAEVALENRILTVKTGPVEANFLTDKGLCLGSLVFPEITESPLIGTLFHGRYDDIGYGADFFSAHLIHTGKDGKKSTDLVKADPAVREDGKNVFISTRIAIGIGVLWKTYEVSKTAPEITISYRLKVDGLQASSLRLGIFTFIPDAFDLKNLWYETVNGGTGPERFYVGGHAVSHDEPVSQSVSASSCLGATEGWIRIGDGDRYVNIYTDKSILFSVPMIRYAEITAENTFFLRLYHSLGEVDDTAWWTWRGYNEAVFRLSGHRT